MSGTVRVVAPATTANLGPGFDCLGAALSLSLEVEATVADETTVDVAGEGAGELASGEDNLIVRAARAVAGDFPGLHLRVRNEIPLARGLGSSAAAIAAGVTIGAAMTGRTMSPQDLLDAGLPLEGHADNLGACLFGGIVLVLDGRRVLPLAASPALSPVVLVPEVRLSTELARRALPETIPHGDGVLAAGRAAALVAILTGAVPASADVLLECTLDVLHQPYRAPLMPDTAVAMKTLRARGLAAVVSGAGPSVLCLLVGGQDVPSMPGWRTIETSWEPRGARVTGIG